MIHQSLITTKLIKTSFQMEDYFELLEHKKAIDFCRFRTTNHKFPIEQGRWDNVEFRKVCVFQILDMPHSFNILLILFNHRKLHLSSTDIWKHNLYIIHLWLFTGCHLNYDASINCYIRFQSLAWT
jgi:hypothetical protein